MEILVIFLLAATLFGCGCVVGHQKACEDNADLIRGIANERDGWKQSSESAWALNRDLRLRNAELSEQNQVLVTVAEYNRNSSKRMARAIVRLQDEVKRLTRKREKNGRYAKQS